MKIAMALFPNSKMGGILTVHNNLKKGLEQLGHEVTDYYLSPNTNKISAPKDDAGGDFYCGGRALGFLQQYIQGTKRVLENYDLVIFSHPCPSFTKAFQDESWKQLFDINTKIITIHHDRYWDKYYPWFMDVLDKVNLIVTIQKGVYDSLHPEMKRKAIITHHPMDLTDMGKYEELKQDLVISTSHFKTCKHIDVLIKSIPRIHKINQNIKFYIYGGGIEYYYMAGSIAKRKERYKVNGKWIWEQALESGMKYKGRVSKKDLIEVYKRAKITTDFSTWKQQGGDEGLNYVVLECMKYGGIPVIRRDNILKPIWSEKNFIIVEEEGGFFGIDSLEDNVERSIIRAIKDFDSYEMKERIEFNFKILKEEYDCKKVAERILQKT